MIHIYCAETRNQRRGLVGLLRVAQGACSAPTPPDQMDLVRLNAPRQELKRKQYRTNLIEGNRLSDYDLTPG